MSSIDLSAAFDVVNVELLIKRLRIIGMPNDVIELITIWLEQRYYYVSLDTGNSYVRSSTVGTVQGSILGPFDRLHRINNRANPDQVTKYRLSLLLHKAYNDQNQGSDWESINFNQNFNARTQTVFFFKTNRYKIGNNLLSNRLNILNGYVTFDMLNLSFDSYKLRMKELFLAN